MRLDRSYSIEELLSRVNYTDSYTGKQTCNISGFCDDFFAINEDLTWTENSSILNKLLSQQSCLTIITNIKIDKIPENKNIIYCNNPLRLFEKIVDSVYIRQNRGVLIEPSSQIHDSVVIGKNVIIGDGCKIAPYVVIGDNVTIGNNVEIGSFSTLGNNPYYTLWDKEQRLRHREIYGSVIIGNNVHIGSYCSIDNGITIETEIGDECKLGNYIEISHDVKIGNNCCICTQSAISGLVSVGEKCIFWGRSGVTNRINIAPRTTILASSILTKSVLTEGQTLCGYPAIERSKYWRILAKVRDLRAGYEDITSKNK